MLKAKEFANAMTIVWLVAYIGCFGLAYFAPSLYAGIAGNWFHSINLQMSNLPPTLRINTLVGFITFGLVVWILSYAFAQIYNRLVK